MRIHGSLKMRTLALILALVAALLVVVVQAAPHAPSSGSAQPLSWWTTSTSSAPLSLAQFIQHSLYDALPRPWRLSMDSAADDGVEQTTTQHSFTLRHAILHPLSDSHPHQTHILNRTTSLATTTTSSSSLTTPLHIRTTRQRILRPANVHAYLSARAACRAQDQCPSQHGLQWDEVDIDAPDVAHRETLLAFAKMASQAYENNTDSWTPGFGGFNLSDSFGWIEDGMRGHVFTSNDNSTIVLAIKGTSPPFFPGGTDTVRRDKENDNLLFSCCCARVSWTWSPVCDCYSGAVSKKKTVSTASSCASPQFGGLDATGPFNASSSAPAYTLGVEAAPAAPPSQQCGQTCLERALVEKSVYYTAAMDLYNNVSYLYPDSQIWITGHSLGGSLSALLGMTFGVPTVTFEAPGERMAAQRLHLPLPPTGPDSDESPVAALPITHVYHTADPIAMGDCQGTGSICSSFGYAMESRCHTGKSIIYDTVGALGWSQSISLHRIAFMAEDLLLDDWDKRVAQKKGEAGSGGGGKSKKVLAVSREGWRTVERRRREARLGAMKWRWPWQGGGRDEDSGGQEDPDGPASDLKRAVPKARNEDACRDCADWKFADKF